MIELVFTVCLLSSTATCEEKTITYLENITPRACLRQAQPELARWNEGNPNWQIRRWTCRAVEAKSIDL